jgi:hypothetical protein
MSYAAVTFDSHGVRCHAWHFRAESDRMTGPHGRAMVVMAHGFGGTKDSGLEPSPSASPRAAIGQRSVLTALSWMATGVASKVSVARGRAPS